MATIIAVLAALATLMAGQATAQQADRPSPVTELEQVDCDADSCSLSWAPTNDPATLRSWDIHVNGQYRTWVPIGNGPTVEYGPGATDPRLRDIDLSDFLQVVPVRPDGVWAPLDATAVLQVTNYGPDFGPGVPLDNRNFGTVAVGSTESYEYPLSGPFSNFWNGPDPVASTISIGGPDAAAFTVEQVVQGDLNCGGCPVNPITLPAELTLASKEGTPLDVAAIIAFRPTRAGAHEATITVTHNGRDPVSTATLTATGLGEPDRPLPITELEQFGCDADSCSLRWTPVNDTATLRSWDVHVNGEYRTWIPIGNGPTVEYGPGATDPRLRNIELRDRIRIVPVRTDGAYAPTDQAFEFVVRDYGPDFGPGIRVRDRDLGVTAVGESSPEIEVVIGALLNDRDGWNGPDATITGVEIVGTDSAAFRVERFVQGQLSCPIENPDCARTVIDLPFTVDVGDQNGFGRAAVVTFTPTRAGLHEASLVVSHNGRSETFTATLRGTGEDGVEFGPGVLVFDEDFGVVAAGDDFIEVEIPIFALLGAEDGYDGPAAVVTDVRIINNQLPGFGIVGFVDGQLSCPVENPDCPRIPIDLPFTVDIGDQNGFGRAVVVRFSAREIGPAQATLVVSHNGVDGVTEATLTALASDPDRPLPITQVSRLGCFDICALGWTPTNDPGSLRAWDVHVNGRYRTWVPIDNGPTLEFGPGAADPRLARVVPGDVIRIVPVRPDGVWAPTELAAEYVVVID